MTIRENGYYWVRPPPNWTNQALFIVQWIDDRWWHDDFWERDTAYTQVGERIVSPEENEDPSLNNASRS